MGGFLVNSPKETVFLYSLDTSGISKTADKVFKMLDDVVKFIDNAANFKAAGKLLMKKMEAFVLDSMCCPLH